jgi:dihydrofolate reductase
MSLDGFIADSEGGYAWIPMDTEIDFGTFTSKIDTLLMGRRTYEVLAGADGPDGFPGMAKYVVSSTLDPAEHPDVVVLSGDVPAAVRELKEEEGQDIWLFGGGVLFRSLLEAGLVDRVEVGVIPAVLGSGVPFLPGLQGVGKLTLHSCEEFGSGIVLLKYDVDRGGT